MATNKTITQTALLKYIVEQGAQAKVIAANQAIKKSMVDIQKAAATGGAVGASEVRRITKESKTLAKELLSLESGFHDIGDDVPRELQDVIDKVEKLNKTIRDGEDDLQSFDDKFGQVSKKVALAGDVESQARTVGGALGAAGLGGAERGISAVSELPAVIEALPKLKASLAGLPAAVASAVKAIGPGIGVALVGFAAIGAAVAKVASDIQKQTAQMNGLIDAQSNFFDILVNGTEADAQARLKEIAAIDARNNAELDALALQIQNARDVVDAYGLVGDVVVGISNAVSATPIEALEKQFNELHGTLSANTAEAARLTAGLEQGAFATETAAEAEARLTDERAKAGQAAVAFAEHERQRIVTNQNLMDQSTEQLDARKKAIQDEFAATSAALKILQESGRTGAEVDAATRAYITTLQALRDEMGVLEDTARPLAAIHEAETAALEEKAEAEKEAIELSKEETAETLRRFNVIRDTMLKRAKLEQNFADELIKISAKAAEDAEKLLSRLEDKLADLGQSLGRDLSDSQRKAQRKVLEAQIDAQREQVQVQQDHLEALQDIRRKADESEFTLRQSRDFKGVANARRAARIAIQDEQRSFVASEKQRVLELKQAATDRQKAFAEERADRLRKFQQDTADARNNFIKERQLAIMANAQAINVARARHTQELSDLQAAGMQALTIRKQVSGIELQMIKQVADVATGLFQQMASFAAFAGNQTTNNVNTNTNTTNVNGISVTGQNTSNGSGLANAIAGVIQGLVQ